MVKDVFDALILQEQLRCSLWSNAGHARNVVRVVPHQPLHINETDRLEAVLLLERRRIVAARLTDALFRQDDGEIRTDELQGIAVTCHDDGLRPRLCRRLRRKRADDVVRLVVVHLEKGDAERRRQFLQQRDLRDQLLGGLVARPLVVRIECRAERRAALVKCNDDLRRRELLQELYEHHCKAVHGIRVDAARIRRELQRVERAEEEAAPVEYGESLRAHRVGISASSRRMRTKQ